MLSLFLSDSHSWLCCLFLFNDLINRYILLFIFSFILRSTNNNCWLLLLDGLAQCFFDFLLFTHLNILLIICLFADIFHRLFNLRLTFGSWFRFPISIRWFLLLCYILLLISFHFCDIFLIILGLSLSLWITPVIWFWSCYILLLNISCSSFHSTTLIISISSIWSAFGLVIVQGFILFWFIIFIGLFYFLKLLSCIGSFGR